MHNELDHLLGWYSRLIDNVHRESSRPKETIDMNLRNFFYGRKEDAYRLYKNFNPISRVKCSLSYYVLFLNHMDRPIIHNDVLDLLAKCRACTLNLVLDDNLLLEFSKTEIARSDDHWIKNFKDDYLYNLTIMEVLETCMVDYSITT